jgi:para-aminobenzoate synthetase component 2
MILLIDNYDSFVYNLARYVGELGYDYLVKRNDAVSLQDIASLSPTHIIISPGPCTPNEAGITLDVIQYFAEKIPILGVCLGHQAIGQAFGGEVVRAKKPMHGRSSLIKHNDKEIFSGMPNPLKVARYHSLVVNSKNFPSCLNVSATSDDGEIMAIKHSLYPIVGVQFHPESVLTEYGHQLLSNFFIHH